MNLNNQEHIEIIKQIAKEHFDEQRKKKKKPNSSNTISNTTEPETIAQNNSNNPTRRNNEHENATFIYSHTIANEQETHHSEQTTKQISSYPGFEILNPDNPPSTFKQTLHEHNTYNKHIINTQFAKQKTSFKQALIIHNPYNNTITKTHFSKQ